MSEPDLHLDSMGLIRQWGLLFLAGLLEVTKLVSEKQSYNLISGSTDLCPK